MHGHPDGVALTCGDFLLWHDLRHLLLPLNRAMQGGLLICMSSCFGRDSEYTVKLDNLKSLEYSDADCERMQEVCDRITKLCNSGKLEDTAISVLKQLGGMKRPYLTPLEEKLLGLVE